MNNVIRPTFGRPVGAQPDPVAPRAVEGVPPLRVYGAAVGHVVALIRAETGDEGVTLQIIVGQEGGQAAETVALFPDTVEGEADAEVAAFAVLRALEIVKEAVVGSG